MLLYSVADASDIVASLKSKNENPMAMGIGADNGFAQVEFVDGEIFLYEGDVTIMR